MSLIIFRYHVGGVQLKAHRGYTLHRLVLLQFGWQVLYAGPLLLREFLRFC